MGATVRRSIRWSAGARAGTDAAGFAERSAPDAAGARPGLPVGRAAAGMALATAISRLFGSARVLVVAAVLGTTYLGNTFQASNAVSNVLFELLAAGALSAVLVPTFVELFGRDDDRGAEEVAGGLLGLALVGLGVVAVAGVVFAPQLARLLTTAVQDPEIAARQQELATFLLRFFVPQIVLYAVGAISTAVLNAKGVFSLPAAAPIGNTVVLLVALGVFRIMAGPDPELSLTTAEKLVLGVGGTLGVAAFVGVPAMALAASGFRFRLRVRAALTDDRVRRLVGRSAWAALQHAGAALLLAAAIVVGGGEPGGVVAYQVAYVVFLTPYGVLAQPIHTTVLPLMAGEASRGDMAGMARSLRWALESMALVTAPVSAGFVVLSLPVMSVLAFGQANTPEGIELLAAAFAALGVGLFPYGAFLLLSRAWYSLGDARTPALAALASSLVGVAVMVLVGSTLQGPARLAALGLGHSVAFLAGTLWLAMRLRPVLGPIVAPGLRRALVLSAPVGALSWAAIELWQPAGRIETVLALVAVTLAGAALYALAVHRTGGLPSAPARAG